MNEMPEVWGRPVNAINRGVFIKESERVAHGDFLRDFAHFWTYLTFFVLYIPFHGRRNNLILLFFLN